MPTETYDFFLSTCKKHELFNDSGRFIENRFFFSFYTFSVNICLAFRTNVSNTFEKKKNWVQQQLDELIVYSYGRVKLWWNSHCC